MSMLCCHFGTHLALREQYLCTRGQLHLPRWFVDNIVLVGDTCVLCVCVGGGGCHELSVVHRIGNVSM